VRVWHPSLKHHPGHDVAVRQMAPRHFGGVLAVELHSEAAAIALPQALQLFGDATSLGGVESLVEWRRKYDDTISPLLLRLSIGLESHVDLQNDLQQAILATRDLST
jgi:cystathionine gamma-synthase